MKAPVSCCLIVKNEGPRLENCLKSIREYVEEIVVVDTGSTDNTPEIAQKYADKFEVFLECNNADGLIEDFSKARQRSFDLATQPWIMWADGDDQIIGGEKLAIIIANLEISRQGRPCYATFPYEYAHDANGNAVIRQYRERLITPKEKFKWINPVHEVLNPEDTNTYGINLEDITFIHRRGNKAVEPLRNLRILQKYVDKIGEADARQLYYLGLEYGNINDFDNMIKYLNRYIELSGWEDEKYMACLRLCTHYLAIGDYDKAIEIGLKSITFRENWAEGYFVLAKAYYLMATIGKDPIRNYQRCVHFGKLGLSLPPTKTLLFVNPMDREFEIHKYLNVALSNLGDIPGALESAKIGLAKIPDDPWLLCNKAIYEKHLARLAANKELQTIMNNGGITADSYNTIMSILDNKPITGISWPEFKKSNDYPKDVTEDSFFSAKVTPHAQAWGIPEQFDFDDLPLSMTEKQLEAVVIMIWKQYVLHDELLAARSFLENAPVTVRHNLSITKALKITTDMYDWLNNPHTMQTNNSPANVMVESGMPLPHKLISQEGARFNLLFDHLPKEKISLVDFGCFDGCFTNRYGLAGHEVLGLDVVETSVALANKKATEFNTGAKHIVTYFKDAADKVPQHYFDYATSTDTYEHLQDHVTEMLLPAKKMLKENGKFLLVTPYQSWTRGKFVSYAHPWLNCKDGIHWLTPNPHGHLIAPTPWSVAKHFKQAGYYVYNSFVSIYTPAQNESKADAPGQGNVFCEAWLQNPKSDKPLDIIFYTGLMFHQWTPETVKETGIGGSELAALTMAKLLAAQGHRVRVYGDPGKDGEGIYEGVEYYTHDKYQDLICDVLIVSRQSNMLDDVYNIQAKLKLLWLHDVVPINFTNRLLLKADRILCLTEWHKQFVVNMCNVHPDQIIVTRNGLDLNRFEKPYIVRNKHKIINSSSPDRSWKTLFDCWDRIRQQVPTAELHLYYGFEGLENMARVYPEKSQELSYFKSKIEEFKDKGVVYHGRINQDQLADEFLSSGVWAHPTNFTETSCISAMEAQAAGCYMISSSVAALKETVGERGILIDGDCNSNEFQYHFVNNIVKLLNSEDDRNINIEYAKQHFSWVDLSQEWEQMFYQLIEELKIHPTLPYYPVGEYR